MKIAIDVTPIRIDGSLGGAMNLCMELIEGFSHVDDLEVVLLTALWNTQDLKTIVPGNIELREVITEQTESKKGLSLLKKVKVLLAKVLRKLGLRHLANMIRSFGDKATRPGKSMLLRDMGADLLFCPFSAPTYKENSIPTVSTINDIQHEYYPQFFTPEENAHRTNFYTNISKRVERVICISNYTKKTFCEKYAFDPMRAETVYIAIQSRFSGTPNVTLIEKYGLAANEYIMYPANFWEHKNHRMLLEAFSMYVSQGQKGKLVLTGNMLNKSEYILDVMKALGIQDRVIVTGYVSEDELYGLYTMAKGIIFPSLFEGFGIPVVEAMYLNKLIACSDSTSLPEIGCASIHYFDPRKPDSVLGGIVYLFNSDITQDIKAEYKQRLEAFSKDKMIQNYMSVFQLVLSEPESRIPEDIFEGIYPDRWSGEELYIQPATHVGKTLTVEIHRPNFLGNAGSLLMDVNGTTERLEINPGENSIWSYKVSDHSWSFRLCVENTWSPAKVLGSEDTRSLGVLLLRADLSDDKGRIISFIQEPTL